MVGFRDARTVQANVGGMPCPVVLPSDTNFQDVWSSTQGMFVRRQLNVYQRNVLTYGQVVDESGRGMANVPVRAFLQGQSRAIAETMTQASGCFVLSRAGRDVTLIEGRFAQFAFEAPGYFPGRVFGVVPSGDYVGPGVPMRVGFPATRLERIPGPGPVPEPSPSPTPSPTASPSPTPSPTASPSPTPSPAPTPGPPGGLRPGDPVGAERILVRQPPSPAKASAPVIEVPLGDSFVLRLRGLPVGARFSIQLQSGPSWTRIGQRSSNRSGRLSLPALDGRRGGEYTLRLLDGNRTYFVKVSVTSQRS